MKTESRKRYRSRRGLIGAQSAVMARRHEENCDVGCFVYIVDGDGSSPWVGCVLTPIVRSTTWHGESKSEGNRIMRWA